MGGASRGSTRGLEVRLLGPVEVLRGGEPVSLGRAKPRMLLAILACDAGRVVSVDRLVEDLWAGSPPETAAHAIQVYVSQLRKALGGETIVTRGPGYALEVDPAIVDAHRFEELVGRGREQLEADDPAGASASLREALALWRGPALVDFLYEPFAQPDSIRLEELRVATLEDRVEADLALGRHAELITELEALVQAQPLRERARAQLMLALYRAGRQADALASYRAARETLVEELGIEPGPELRELEAAILRQDSSLLLEEAALARPAMQFRRLVTILFCDVVESMGLAGALDPEALGRVLQSYFETVSAAIARHGGTVEKYAGDAVMAAFGVPVSHEDDALRAARAALEIRAGIASLNERLVRQHGVGLEIRIGIESGEVVATPTDARQRLVTGEAVGIAAKLEQAAGADETVVGEVAGRLIDHAATLEPLGAIPIKGKREPVRAYRLHQLRPVAPAFRQRRDARLVGRKRELAALRKALKRAVEGRVAQVAIVVGSPGVGKSRLTAELTARAKGVTALWGRCLAYGDGITYWPLREVLEHAPASEERTAVLAALEAETPPPAAEIAWLFRRFCEATARQRSLVVVFDDLHWAEPTFLDLVEHLVERGEGAIFVVCLAREDILDEGPHPLDGIRDAERLVLEPLSTDEAEALVDGLGGSVLESDQRARIVEAAEGNPLFLEQLLALALEGGVVERPLPETIQALLAARLDRLGPGERAVLERGAVVGKEFTAGDLVALLDPEAAPTVPTHLESLAGRGFVRPRGDGAYAFRHVLVQEAVYRAAPKRLRAELHERFADRLDDAYPDLPDLDEFVGYHLEQAYRMRTELGETDRRAAQLADDAGHRLGYAGMRAFKRGDMHTASGLLDRSTRLLPDEDARRGELLCDLGLSYHALQDTGRAVELLERVHASSESPAVASTHARARIELEYIRVGREPRRTADALLEAIEDGLRIFEQTGDHRALGRAYLLSGWVYGGHRGNHTAWANAAERAVEHYGAAGWPISLCLGEVASAMYWGPATVTDAVARLEALLEQPVLDRRGAATLESFLGGLVAQVGDFDRGRALAISARGALEALGLRASGLTYSATVLGDIEALAGNAAGAEAVLRQLCGDLQASEDHSHLASRASELAQVLVSLDRLDEADDWTKRAESAAAPDDVDAQLMWRVGRASILARRGAHERAEELARGAVQIADATDALNRRALAYEALAAATQASGRRDGADAARRTAIELYEQKGNLVGAERVRALQRELTAV